MQNPHLVFLRSLWQSVRDKWLPQIAIPSRYSHRPVDAGIDSIDRAGWLLPGLLHWPRSGLLRHAHLRAHILVLQFGHVWRPRLEPDMPDDRAPAGEIRARVEAGDREYSARPPT